jgi:hypothetical protein
MRRDMCHANAERPVRVEGVLKMSNRKGDGVKEMVKLRSAGRCTCWQRTLLSSIHSSSARLYKLLRERSSSTKTHMVVQMVSVCIFWFIRVADPPGYKYVFTRDRSSLVFFAAKQSYLDIVKTDSKHSGCCYAR